MQRISFTTSAGTITIDDVNTSSIGGERILRLNEFDPNSAKTRVEAVQCIGMSGQKVLSSVVDTKTVTAKISFAPVYFQNNRFKCTGAAGMYSLRREVLRRFPLNIVGTLTYTNDCDTYTIKARIDQAPTVATRDGYLCECTILFTCDYPYWCKAVTSEKLTVSSGGSVIFTPPEYGDIASPIGGIIDCTQTLTADENGIYYNIVNTDNRFRRVDFCEPLYSGTRNTFNLLYNNEWNVPGDIYFVEYSEPCVSYPNSSRFCFSLPGTGSAEVRLIYYNLYVAV